MRMSAGMRAGSCLWAREGKMKGLSLRDSQILVCTSSFMETATRPVETLCAKPLICRLPVETPCRARVIGVFIPSDQIRE